MSVFKSKATRESGFGAENGIRTRDLNLGKVALYQLSYFRDWDCKYTTKFTISKKNATNLYRNVRLPEPSRIPEGSAYRFQSNGGGHSPAT